MSGTGLPTPWEVRMSKTRAIPYYFNQNTQESRWEPPEDTDTDRLKAYMLAKYPSVMQSSDGGSGKIRAAHLLVKHTESRRPSSWKQDVIERSKEKAMEMIEGFEQQIKSGSTTLAELAKNESDCSSARKGGDLGYFGRGDMQKAFEDAAFSLEPGQMSGVVSTDSGLHLIERIA
ncbi:hypothetical protein H072_9909 [Dactylellina haptotyla CBS 200.50]|uniref:Peptidyl-prolyl cis-trans isomerase n=1 Tax=Dactylellina haptotyla (strain CBS 200.50) TaxID=1284197 RepID=S8BMY1_DACHA|nr:hypothetical protein H072_9909 [Dactylellina haptotyla CBS 200.50]